MVYQTYETNVNVESVIRGNSVVIRCPIPSYVADYVSVDSWLVDATEIFADHWGTSSHTFKHPHYSSLSSPAPSTTLSCRCNDDGNIFLVSESQLNDCIQDSEGRSNRFKRRLWFLLYGNKNQ